MTLYLPVKDALASIVRSYFPDEIAKRFTYRMDDEIWIASEDEAVFNRRRAGNMSCHILFDRQHIAEVPPKLDRKRAELWVLWSIRDAIKSGVINVDKVAEFTDNKTIRANKKALKEKKRRQLIDSIKEAQANPMSDEVLRKMVADQTARAAKAQEVAAEAEREKQENAILKVTKGGNL